MQLIPPVWLQSCLFLHELHLAPHLCSLIMPGLGCSGFVETSLKLRWIVSTLGPLGYQVLIAKLRAILVEPYHFDSFYLI